MKVSLAGFNVDTAVLRELEAKVGKRQDLTPEVISAAYARISRDPRPIEEIRKDARLEVERARRSNRTIIFKMGHHSVAEHAVFNLDILGVSRYAMEELERFRLCSYTEKSQRYITLESAFVIPEEIKERGLEKPFVETVKIQNQAYFEFFSQLKEYVFTKNKDLAKNPKNHSLLEGWAKEDARYVTSLATESQVGLTINARNLELLLRRFASSPLKEIQLLGQKIYAEIYRIAPSIVIFHQANDRDRKTYPDLKKLIRKILKKRDINCQNFRDVELVSFTLDGDEIIASALLHTCSSLNFKTCIKLVKTFSQKEKEEIFKTSWRHLQFYDSLLREFEYAEFIFNIMLSAACFAQLKRHRMTTITSQSYEPDFGITIPDSIIKIGKQKEFKRIIQQTNEVYRRIKRKCPLAAPYILTNAHRKRVLLKVNVRELYHICRLRQDQHAQWDIRNLASKLSKEAKRVMPLSFKLICGKDAYNEVYKSIFGRLPKVSRQELPGERKIE